MCSHGASCYTANNYRFVCTYTVFIIINVPLNNRKLEPNLKMIIPIIINNNNKNSNDTIHTQKRKILFTDHHNTSVTNVHTRRTMWGARRSVLPDPPITPSGTATNQKTIKKNKTKKSKVVVETLPGSC